MAFGSGYIRPGNGERILNITNGLVSFTGGNLASAIVNQVSLGTNNRVTNLSSNKRCLTLGWFCSQDPLAWRQWHHWNVLHDDAEVDLPKGISVLTVHMLKQGNMNLAFFDFRPVLL